MRAAFAYLAVLGAAFFTGTMICIGLAFGGYWRSLPPDAFLAWFATNEGFIARTIPVVAGPAALGLLASLWLARHDRVSRPAWLVAVASMVGVGLVTALYHLPTNAAFAKGAVASAAVPATLATWLWLHTLRAALGALASGAALHAVAKGRSVSG